MNNIFVALEYVGNMPHVLTFATKEILEETLNSINCGNHIIPESFNKVKNNEIEFTVVYIYHSDDFYMIKYINNSK
jgi:hypothetical protein